MTPSDMDGHRIVDETARSLYQQGCDAVRNAASGSVQSILNKTAFGTMTISLPHKAEQLAVSSILSALDDKIELNRRKSETLEAKARALFSDWFVDFGSTRTKMLMRGDDPQKAAVAPAPYLDLWSLLPDRLDPATSLPEGWADGTLTDVAKLNPKDLEHEECAGKGGLRALVQHKVGLH